MSEQNQIDPMVVSMFEKVKELGFEGFENIIALSRWPDGERLSPEEMSAAMQALIMYEHQNVALSDRTGFIHKGKCDS